MDKNSTTIRIGVDMAATAGQKSGLGFYVEHTVNAMKEVEGNHELVEICTIKKQLHTPQRILWDQIGLPIVAARKQLDILWVPAFSAPRFYKPMVMTAHDIFGVLHPDQFSHPSKYYWTTLLPESMKRADHLICISEHTKKDIVNTLGIREEKCSVVPLAASEQYRVMNDVEWIKRQLQKLNVRTPFILSVGTLEPRKNYERLVEAFAYSSRRKNEQRDGVTLVVVGKKGWNVEGLYQKIQKFRLEDAVQLLDYVTEEQLLALYNACLFFVMPSVFEGFGLPALEAMQCAAPVSVSQNSSLPEVVGDAGVLFDPYSVESIRDRLNLLLTNENMRKQMQKKSLQRSKVFSWKKTASETLDIIKRVKIATDQNAFQQ